MEIVVLDDLLLAITRAARDTPHEELPRLRAALAQADSIALSRVVTPCTPIGQHERRDDPEERLLALPQVAAILGVPDDYAYVLARQRKIPTVRPPGLDKGGRKCPSKYVRVKLSSLLEWIAKLDEDSGIEIGARLNAVLKSSHERQRGTKDPKGARPVADRVRQARGRHVRDGEQVGDGGEQDPRAHREAHQAPRSTG